MPVDKVVPLIRAGRLDEAQKVCLLDHETTPVLYTQLREKGIPEDLCAQFVDPLNQGHIREMFWIAAAAVKSNKWSKAAEIGRIIQGMPGLKTEAEKTAQILEMAGSEIEDVMAMTGFSDRDAVIQAMTIMRETLQTEWVPQAENDMLAVENDVKDSA